MAQIPNLQTLCPDFSPAFEAEPIVAKSSCEGEDVAKRARWYCVLGLRRRPPMGVSSVRQPADREG